MDSNAHLRKLGWRGSGYSLDQTNRGLARPLLISYRSGNGGLGQKRHAESQADQWWLNAFDSALKDLGSGKSSALEQAREHGITRGGLYGCFVKGETIDSTFTEEFPKDSTIKLSTRLSVPDKSISGNSNSAADPDSIEDSTPTATPEASPPPFSAAMATTITGKKDKYLKKRKRTDNEDAGNAKQHKSNNVISTEKDVVDTTVCPPEHVALKRKANKALVKDERTQLREICTEPNREEKLNPKDPELRKREKNIRRKVAAELKRRELAGEFGPTLPHPLEFSKWEMDAAKAGPDRFPETQLAALSVVIHGPPKNGLYKPVAYKEEKSKHAKLKREAEQEIQCQIQRAELGEEFFGETTLPTLTEEERAVRHHEVVEGNQKDKADVKKKKRKQKTEPEERSQEQKMELEERRQKRKAAHQLKALEDAERLKMRKQQKRTRLAERKEARKQSKLALAAMDVEDANPLLAVAENEAPNRPSNSNAESDDIKQSLDKDARVGEIYPAVGKRAEKKKKRMAQVLQAGIIVEEPHARLETKRVEKIDPEVGNIAELHEQSGGLSTKQSTKSCNLSGQSGLLSKRDELKYRRKAAKKGITLEALIKRKAKKAAKKAAAKARGRKGKWVKKNALISKPPTAFRLPIVNH